MGACLPTAALKNVLFFGDSLTAGFGLTDPALAFPGLIEGKLGAGWRAINAGLAGETTAGALRRLDEVLKMPFEIAVVELGANDGIRGVKPEVTEQNLQQIIDRLRGAQPDARLLLVGMFVPENLGTDYTRSFEAIFPNLAGRNNLPLIPCLLSDVADQPGMVLSDGIHPSEQGHQRIADKLWQALKPLLPVESCKKPSETPAPARS